MTSAFTEAGRSQSRRHPPHDGDGDAAVLAHHELGRGRQFVRHADLGGGELPPARIEGAPQIDHGGHPGAADGDVGHARAATGGRRCPRR